MNFLDNRLPGRFWNKVSPCPMSGCWIWTGYTNAKGYGIAGWKFPDRYRVTSSHRIAYQQLVGPIPNGLQLDHLCRVRSCCNPAHLEPVTNEENTRRGDNRKVVGAIHAEKMRSKTHCPHGHLLTGTRKASKGRTQRYCKTCLRERGKARRKAA